MKPRQMAEHSLLRPHAVARLTVSGSRECQAATHPPCAAQWKSSAVVGMLERRVGDDQFRKLLQRLVTAAARQPIGGVRPAPDTSVKACVPV